MQFLSLFFRKYNYIPVDIYNIYFKKSKSLKQILSKKMSTFSVTPLIFQGKLDLHKGISIESKNNFCKDSGEFNSRLEESLKTWRIKGLRGIWFNVALPQIEWIPILSEKGFKIHHAKGDVISLYLWLPENESCKIPHYAHNMVGAGAVVINDSNQVLVVREQYRSVPFWKLPGGYVNPGEDIGEAAMREVMEETSIKTEFVSLVSLRQTPRAVFGCSDMYFVVRLKPLTYDILKQDEEIEDCKWMDIEEYLSHPEVHENNRMFVRQAIQNEKEGIVMKRESAFHPVTKVPQYLFTISKESTSN